MILAGIDMGIETTKVVIMKDGAVIGRAKTSTGGIDRPQQAELAYKAALENAGISAEEVDKVSATGKGKYDIAFAEKRVTETIASVHAGKYLCPDLTSVISVGSDEVLIATIGQKRLVGEYVLNQKCSAGIGTFLQMVSARLELPIEKFGELDTEDAPAINENCVVFAELDVLDLLNNAVAPEKIAAACVKAAAVSAARAANDLTIPANDKVVLIGGLTQNKAFVKALEKQLGFGFVVPEDAEYAGAIGAAISGEKGIYA